MSKTDPGRACAIVWLRNDLRLADNPALQAAIEAGFVPVCIYLHAPAEEGDWVPGAASDAWRHRSLAALDADLRARGSRLLLRHGPSEEALIELVRETGASAVFWNRKYEPATQVRDAGIKRRLKEQGIQAESFNAALLFEPWSLATQQGGPYRVFTPFWRNALSQWRLPALRQAPAHLPEMPRDLAGLPLAALGLKPSPDWDRGFWETWQPGEAGAHEALEVFTDGALRGYRSERDRPDRVGTSLLSPHLHFGEIAPWRIVASLEHGRTAANGADVDAYVRELGWREFAWHLLHHFPQTTTQNLNPRFTDFDWARQDGTQLRAWREGRTGVPIVDAGMRELWHTGYMHNRVRMIVASWLTKHMRQHWLHGARWFWDTLVDADLANNTLGWQWVAGTGADAAPYFRVFNPVTQARKFDPDARYITRWVPELSALPPGARFAPWESPELRARLAPGYPAVPMVDLAEGRDAALAAYKRSSPPLR
ncbi:MAG: deoxyribodipyrimidine photo-lyase [Lysobacteraceae bacterium]|nr:MAG: deoxyribodipyrimidine photo-lyase [Xanthomonadaceae bacterium]